jgi:hypothetical protein
MIGESILGSMDPTGSMERDLERTSPQAAAFLRISQDPDVKIDVLWNALIDHLQEYGEQLIDRGLDGVGMVEVWLALIEKEITPEDLTQLLDAVHDGTFKLEMLERRKLLLLARKALESR